MKLPDSVLKDMQANVDYHTYNVDQLSENLIKSKLALDKALQQLNCDHTWVAIVPNTSAVTHMCSECKFVLRS
jgi:hypothetical protein